jgi:UDP-N-acetylglucosamine 4,6-dehydratase
MATQAMRSVLVTGGTGSFGKAFVRRLLRDHPEVQRIVVYSRDELKQWDMARKPEFTSPKLRFFIGDVRDQPRLLRALENVDTVIHAAALKQIPAAEYNPFEAIKTNVIGAQNVIECSMDRGVSRIVALSTDKAAAPINLYGATKLCSDKLFVAANAFKGQRDFRTSVVRYGNVLGSRGSVVPLYLERAASGVLPVTDPLMTRFTITLEEAVDLVLFAHRDMWGGELYVPKLPSYRITDVAEAIAPGARIEHTGIRPGEKLHEEMITHSDAANTVELDRHYVVLPSIRLWDVDRWIAEKGGQRCAEDFQFDSGNNSWWVTVEELRDLIRTHVDPSFAPVAAPPTTP